MAVMTRKIQIIPEGTKEQFNEIYKQLKDWRYDCFRLANHILTEKYTISLRVVNTLNTTPDAEWKEVEENIMRDRLRAYAGKAKKIAASFDYCLTKAPDWEKLPSAIRLGIATMTKSAFKTDHKELLQGTKSLRNYKRESMNIPIPAGQGRNARFVYDEGAKEFYFETIKKLRFKVNFGRDTSNNKLVVDRLISKEYKMPDVFLKLEKNKIFVYVPVTVPNNKPTLDPELSVGVDLGITIPAYCALSKGHNKLAIGSGKQIKDFRFQMKKRKTSLQRSIQLSNGGKGRKKKLQAVDKLGKYESNWIKTKNHEISKNIVEFAVKNGAGTIKMEFLEGFTKENSENMVLKNWTYFQLQTMIKYKADKEGIKVIYIDPYHTSQTCSKCGHHDKDNRQSQEKFVCTECGFDSNADYNAAVNIAKSDKVVTKKEQCTYYKLKNKEID